MALIKCSECGRTVSDKASACVGCGAPIGKFMVFNAAPEPTFSAPLSGRQLTLRGLLAASILAVGIIWASAADHQRDGGRFAETMAALLIIVGLCWCIVTILQGVSSYRK